MPHQEERNFSAPFSAAFETTDEKTEIPSEQNPLCGATDLSHAVKHDCSILQAVGLFYKLQDGLGGSEASQLDV